MYCPTCGAEELQPTQFCRGCGAELQSVRAALQRAEGSAASHPSTSPLVRASGANAKEEIGLAIASKIRELKDARHLKRIVEDVLPKVEQFLETPEEKRLRRIREGITTAFVGIGLTVLLGLLGLFTDSKQLSPFWGVGALVFFIGLGIAASGWLFSGGVQSRRADRDQSASLTIRGLEDEIEGGGNGPEASKTLKGGLQLAPPSVTEVTTRTLAAERRSRQSETE